jgi:hypothetical protein
MIPMDFDWLANVLATDYQGDNRQVININTDTRTLCDGEVFLALKGLTLMVISLLSKQNKKVLLESLLITLLIPTLLNL